MSHAPTAPRAESAQGYLSQLDALRGLAVIGVCLHHWTGSSALSKLPLDSMRVQLFFALSGFLITMILLNARAKAERAGSAMGWTLGAFYARRSLRIWPLFFLVLILSAALDLRPTRETFWWHAGFLTNFKIYLDGQFTGITTHFWSLAVEEQFYLVWPWLMLLTPRSLLTPVLIGVAVLLSGVHSVLIAHAGPELSGFLPTACVNALVYGSILAVHRDRPGLDWLASRLAIGVGLPMCVLAWWMNQHGVLGPLGPSIQRAAAAIVLGWVVLRVARGVKSGPVCYLLNFRPLLWIGSISYGIYIMHNLPLTILREYFNPYPVRVLLANEWTRVLALGGITVALSALSYYAFEMPINRLKRFFPYVRTKTVETPPPPTYQMPTAPQPATAIAA